MRFVPALTAVLSFSALLAGDALAITADPFGANGEGGVINGQNFTVGTGGVAFEVEGLHHLVQRAITAHSDHGVEFVATLLQDFRGVPRPGGALQLEPSSCSLGTRMSFWT